MYFLMENNSKGMTKLLFIPAWIYDFLTHQMDAFACLWFFSPFQGQETFLVQIYS